MAKSSGLGDQLYIDGYNLSGDVGALDTIGSPLGMHEATGIDKSAKERIRGQADGLLEFTSYFNPSTNQAHERLSALPTTDVVATYFRGQAIGNAGAGMVAKQANYDMSRGEDGSLTFKTSLMANGYALNWGEQLTPGIATIGTAGAQTALDYGASVDTTEFGLQAFLQVFALTGTSATVAVQSSSDDGAVDSWANVTGAVFTAATGPTAERVETARDEEIERYLRVNVTGTFTLCWFSVLVCRNLAAAAF